MTTRIIKPAVVEQDLAEITDYLRQKSPAAALRFIDAAESSFQQLAEMPEAGGLWESDQPNLAGLRVWPVKGFEKYLIFYRPSASGIGVVRILHGSRNLETLLGH